MSYGAGLRTWAENLILGSTGTTRTMTAGRFHLESADVAQDGGPVNSCERAIHVRVKGRNTLDGVNTIDSSGLYTHEMTVRVSYALTNAGGDAAETVTEQSGAGTVDAINDRATTDQHDIDMVLFWHENAAGTSPAVVNITSRAPDDVAFGTDRATLTLQYTLTVEVTQPGSYAP